MKWIEVMRFVEVGGVRDRKRERLEISWGK